MGKVETIEHTADVGIRVEAATLEELFQLAARGMFSIVADLSTVEPQSTLEISLSTDDVEELLYDWLRELLYPSAVSRLLFCDFAFRRITETDLDAIVSGETIDFEKHVLHTEVKAVTKYNFSVEKVCALWIAEVVFDI